MVTPLSGPVHTSPRPKDIILSLESLRSSARNCFPDMLEEITDLGAFLHVTARVASPSKVPGTSKSARDLADFVCMITHRSLEEMALEKGSQVHLAFKALAAHVF